MVRHARTRDERAAQRAGDGLIRRRLVCRGGVQGVGFRPAVHRLATQLGLAGSVRNDADGATVEVEGPRSRVEPFGRLLADALPRLARLDAVEVSDVAPRRASGFAVETSVVSARRRALVPPDAALCDACRAEMDDPTDRRHRYAFTTCTNCGPRFTLVRSLPYDRSRTSMAPFPLCARCRAEYDDPTDRRFHAEPLCCPACGPELRLRTHTGELLGHDQRALEIARARLASCAVVAIKGLGGFQLACRADDQRAIARLRRAKRRPSKPFAVMVRDLEHARRVVLLRPEDETLLRSARGPIVLAPRCAGGDERTDGAVAGAVAPGLQDVGVLLPTTPLHVELFRDAPYDALVMTSGNVSDEPICRTEGEARERLRPLCDLVLTHDREIVRRADDSVVRTRSGGTTLVRRSRGWVPEPLPLPEPAGEPVLALGGHLQTTACLATGDEAFPSQHVGDLDTDAARAFLLEAARGLEDFLERTASTIAVDLHPDYPSTWAGERLARERGGTVVHVQHHLAHAAAVLAEHRRFPRRGERVAALVLDGTGYGPDGTAWGCEVLALDGDLRWQRLGHARELALVGGESAVREPWRVACAALQATGRADVLARTPLARRVPAEHLALVLRLAGRGPWPRATGAGRVFEAAGALFGLATTNEYEGEAAARFEALAARHRGEPEIWTDVGGDDAELRTDLLLTAVAQRLAEGAAPPAELAAGFHATFCRHAADLVAGALPPGTHTVALGGGCLVNRLLAEGLQRELERRGLEPLFPAAAPPGDGGLSYGQAVLATVARARGACPVQGGNP